MMFNAKYEEDSSISSKIMGNSIFEKVKMWIALKYWRLFSEKTETGS